MTYVLYQKGVYIRQIWGVFNSEEKAKAYFSAAYENAKENPPEDSHHDWDGYHSYILQKFPVNGGVFGSDDKQDLSYEAIKEKS